MDLEKPVYNATFTTLSNNPPKIEVNTEQASEIEPILTTGEVIAAALKQRRKANILFGTMGFGYLILVAASSTLPRSAHDAVNILRIMYVVFYFAALFTTSKLEPLNDASKFLELCQRATSGELLTILSAGDTRWTPVARNCLLALQPGERPGAFAGFAKQLRKMMPRSYSKVSDEVMKYGKNRNKLYYREYFIQIAALIPELTCEGEEQSVCDTISEIRSEFTARREPQEVIEALTYAKTALRNRMQAMNNRMQLLRSGDSGEVQNNLLRAIEPTSTDELLRVNNVTAVGTEFETSKNKPTTHGMAENTLHP